MPLIFSGAPTAPWRGQVRDQIACLEDVMPTLLTLCGIKVPETVEGIDLLSDTREKLYAEIGEGRKATRMVTDGRYKLIYYPCGNVFQLFDTKTDPNEHANRYDDESLCEIRQVLYAYLIENLYGDDLSWIKDGQLVGFDAGTFSPAADYALYNQRGLHWPAPGGYTNTGRT